jgi:RNA polymerase sigma-32 factor
VPEVKIMSADLALFEKSLSVGSLSEYIRWTNQLPMLTLEEEKELTHRLKHHNDLEAARKLVLSHLRLVVKIARGFSGYGLQQADLIQEGNIGLMKAVRRFDPGVGVRLMTYAIHWIRAEMHEFIIKNWRIVKIATTKAQRKLFFNLRKMAQKNQLNNTEINMIAQELKVTTNDVKHMAQRMFNNDQGFDTPIASSSEEQYTAPSNWLENDQVNPENLLETHDWKSQQSQKLQKALLTLTARDRDILQKRWLSEKKTTLQELAKTHRVSAERIRQIEKNILKQLRINLDAD